MRGVDYFETEQGQKTGILNTTMKQFILQNTGLF